MNTIIFLLSFFLILQPNSEGIFDRLKWDPQYEDTIQKISQHAGEDQSEIKKNQLLLSGVTSDRNVLRKQRISELSQLCEKIKSSILLEYGNANVGSYGMIWILETPEEIFVIREDGEKTALSKNAYETLWLQLEKLKVWNIASDANLKARDFTSYFLSVFSNGVAHQAAIYAPPHGNHTAQKLGIHLSADNFSLIIKKIKEVQKINKM
jgi:hypothetical protein